MLFKEFEPPFALGATPTLRRQGIVLSAFFFCSLLAMFFGPKNQFDMSVKFSALKVFLMFSVYGFSFSNGFAFAAAIGASFEGDAPITSTNGCGDR